MIAKEDRLARSEHQTKFPIFQPKKSWWIASTLLLPFYKVFIKFIQHYVADLLFLSYEGSKIAT